MTGAAADEAIHEHPSRPLLTLGRVDTLSIQVGYQSAPGGSAYEWFLLDLSVAEPDVSSGQTVLDEARVLAALEPVLLAGADAPRHYSLHQHRRHTSWGASPGVLELGLLVATGPGSAALSPSSRERVKDAFRSVLSLVAPGETETTARDAAILRARGSAAAAYALDPATLSLSAEEHRPAENSWLLAFRAPDGDEYDVVVGFVDGYAGSVRVRHKRRLEVSDSLGSE